MMTTDTPAPDAASGRPMPVEAVVSRYRMALAQMTERAIIAEAQAASAEEECAALRLRVIELEEQTIGDVG